MTERPMRATVYSTRGRDTYSARLLRALLSSIIPGLGQLAAGVRRRAVLLLLVFVAVTAAGIFFLTRGFDSIAAWVVQPKILLTLLWVDIIVMLIRLFAVVDAWLTAKNGLKRPARRSSAGRFFAGMGLVLLLLFTVAPHAVAGYYTVVSRNLLTNVFAGNDHPTSTTQKSTTSSGGKSGTTAGSSTSGTTSGTTSTTAGQSSRFGTGGRMTILLIGTDAGYGRTGARSDSMNVATIDLKTGQVAMFGLPRNAMDAPLGAKTAQALAQDEHVKTVNGKKVWGDLLNALYTAGIKHPEITDGTGDSGAEAVRETASLMLGMPIDYYAVVNMMGLVDMVNAVGGVTVHLKSALHITYAPLNAGEAKKTYVFKVGSNKLDGLEALAFARDRSDSDDYVRMGRQRCVMMAMLYQNSVASLTLHFPKIASALEKSVKTDIPVGALPDLIKLRSKVQASSMITEGFTPPDYLLAGSGDKDVLDIAKIKAAVKMILNHPDRWIADHPADSSGGGASDCWKGTK